MTINYLEFPTYEDLNKQIIKLTNENQDLKTMILDYRVKLKGLLFKLRKACTHEKLAITDDTRRQMKILRCENCGKEIGIDIIEFNTRNNQDTLIERYSEKLRQE